MISDWAAPSIKLEKLHKRLDDCLNMKKHSEAFSILLEMQGEVLKLQRFVLYGKQPNYEWNSYEGLAAQHLDAQAIKSDN